MACQAIHSHIAFGAAIYETRCRGKIGDGTRGLDKSMAKFVAAEKSVHIGAENAA